MYSSRTHQHTSACSAVLFQLLGSHGWGNGSAVILVMTQRNSCPQLFFCQDMFSIVQKPDVWLLYVVTRTNQPWLRPCITCPPVGPGSWGLIAIGGVKVKFFLSSLHKDLKGNVQAPFFSPLPKINPFFLRKFTFESQFFSFFGALFKQEK